MTKISIGTLVLGLLCGAAVMSWVDLFASGWPAKKYQCEVTTHYQCELNQWTPTKTPITY